MLLVLFQPKALTPTVETQLKAPIPLTLQLVNLQLKTPTTPTPLPQLLLFNAPALPTLALVVAAAVSYFKALTTPTLPDTNSSHTPTRTSPAQDTNYSHAPNYPNTPTLPDPAPDTKSSHTSPAQVTNYY